MQKQLEREKQERQEYSRREIEQDKKEFRRGLLKALIITPIVIANFCFLAYGAMKQENKKVMQRELENKILEENRYVIPERFSIKKSGTLDEPTTTATYEGKNYLVKVGENGIPYFELYEIKSKEVK